MDRNQKVATLLARRAEDERRLALDELDATARRTNTFGSKEHRSSRDRVEKTYDDARQRLEGFGDDELDRQLAEG